MGMRAQRRQQSINIEDQSVIVTEPESLIVDMQATQTRLFSAECTQTIHCASRQQCISKEIDLMLIVKVKQAC